MKFLIVLSMWFLFSVNCYAKTPSSLIEGTLTYQEVLKWSKDKINQEARKDFSAIEIQAMLRDFPITLDDRCGDLKLLFIKNTPQCGNVNCRYFVFNVEPSLNQKKSYHYVREVSLATEKLFCYQNNNKYDYYLVTSEQETNASSIFTLYQFAKKTLVHKAQIEIDYSKEQEKNFAESLWGNHVKQSDLLKGFKIK